MLLRIEIGAYHRGEKTMTRKVRLVRPNFYHRPVADLTSVEFHNHEATKVTDSITREELISGIQRSFQERCESVGADRRERGMRIFASRTLYELHWQYLRLLRSLERDYYSKQERREARRRLKALKRDINWKEIRTNVRNYQVDHILVGYEFSPHEGSRYPARFEPRYASILYTQTGVYVAYHSRDFLPLVLEEQNDRWLASIYLYFN